MAHNITPVNTFSTTIVVPNDGEIADAMDLESPVQALANRTENLNIRTQAIESHVSADEWTYPTPKARTIILSPYSFCAQGTVAYQAGIGSGQLAFKSNAASVAFPLDILPDGVQITAIRALLKPGAARIGTSRMKLQLLKRRLISFSAPDAGSAVGITGGTNDDGTVNVQAVVETLGTAYAITKATSEFPYIEVTAGADAGTNNDWLYALQVSFTDPGPRNL